MRSSKAKSTQLGGPDLVSGQPSSVHTVRHEGRAHAPVESAFGRLDDLTQRPRSFGTVRVVVEPEAFPSLSRHLARRAAEHGRRTVVSAGAPVADAWQQLAGRLGVLDDADNGDVMALCERIVDEAKGAMVIVGEHRETAWGTLLADELARRCQDPEAGVLLVVLRPQREPTALEVPSLDVELSAAPQTQRAGAQPLAANGGTDEGDHVDLDLVLEELTPQDGRRWWSAVVSQDGFVHQRRFHRLAALDAWWQQARDRAHVEEEPEALDGDDGKLLSYAVAAEQALTVAQATLLVSAEARDSLIERGAVVCDGGGAISAQDARLAKPLTKTQKRRLADVLVSCDADAWSCMRAAELRVECGDVDDAEQLVFGALRRLHDATARVDLWQRWEQLVDHAAEDQEVQLGRLIRSAEKALSLGDGDRADHFARRAMALDSERFDVLLLHGRACNARGDVTTAALSLSRAIGVAHGDGERARAAGLMAQVRLIAGDPKQAERFASEAIELAADAPTTLEGRNVLGKLLLAREAWSEAEQHFAADAYEAAIANESEAELRARLNRAISVLYLGRREKAREMLEEVMLDGHAQGVHRAVAFALSNLAAIAIMEHRYERALALSERAIDVRRKIGGRVGMVQPITNLAELRLSLGLVDEAEQGLRFGLQACGQDLPLSRYAYFAKAWAQVHLERGNTHLAARELATAMSGATCSGEKSVVEQCHRIAARIALEDGDVARARSALDHAAKLRRHAYAEAELRVLLARAARAGGKDFMLEAREALAVAQEADDPEALRDAHVLMHHAYVKQSDEAAAASHLRAAVDVRNRVAEVLPGALRIRYLGRRALVELAALESELHGYQSRGYDHVSTPSSPAVDSDAVATQQAPRRRLIGDSPAMRALRGMIKRVAVTSTTVLIQGETGTGKELVAEAIHHASARSSGPLVKVNCAALVETLLLSELFGHEKGAFTGASARRRGRFEVAEGGTLFLDEIGDISPRTQVALLRVLQDHTFERVGGTTSLRANVRIVCATHRDLRGMVERGEFREDLYYRLCGVVLEAPALRDRASDVPMLAEALLERAQRTHGIEKRSLSKEAQRALSRYPWPGNVRELENALRVAALFARGGEISVNDFSDNVEGLRKLPELLGDESASGSIPPPASSDALPQTIPPPAGSTDLVYAEVRSGMTLSDMKKRIEQECIARALVDSGGNITRAASLLGMKRPRLSQLVKQYKLSSVLEDIKS